MFKKSNRNSFRFCSWQYGLIAFIILNLFLYLFIIIFNHKVQFNTNNYYQNAHHYLQDQRVLGNKFSLINAFGQYDSQWYLKIASAGYPKNPTYIDQRNKTVMEGLSYGFFPFYPLLLSVPNLVFKNIELTAFFISNFLLIANFLSFNFVAAKIFSTQIAIKSSLLLFFFPFAIFFRGYFAESLMLFLLIWFAYLLTKKRWLVATCFLAILSITKHSALSFNFVFIYLLFKEIKTKDLTIAKAGLFIGFSFVPFLIWLVYCFAQTGNPLYSFTVRSSWLGSTFPLLTFWRNIQTVSHFDTLPFHYFHTSIVDILMIFLTLYLLIKSRIVLPSVLWLFSFVIWLIPLFGNDTMSFSRYQAISFPLFVYLASVLSKTWYLVVVLVFFVGLSVVSLYFINWYWIG